MNSSLDAGIPLLTEIVISPSVVPLDEGTREATSAAVALVAAKPVGSTGYATPRVPVTSAVLATPPATPITAPSPPSSSTAPGLRVDFPTPELSLPLHADAMSDPPLLFESRHALSAEDLEKLEINISERISRQVLSRIDFVLEQRVRDSLADVLQLSVEGLALDIKRGLHQTLEDVISRAVAQEIARLQTPKM